MSINSATGMENARYYLRRDGKKIRITRPRRFWKLVYERCRKAGVPGRAHGLRKAGATILADNGATDQELMAIYGWTTLRQAELYTRKANRKRLAESGILKLKINESYRMNREQPIDPHGLAE